jgi:hypothetical protein
MPGALRKRHKLHELAIATDQQVSRDFKAANLRKIRMRVPVQLIGEQLLDFGAAETSGWQTDTVQNDERGIAVPGPRILVGAGTLPGGPNEPRVTVDLDHNVGQYLLCHDGTTIVTFDGINQTFY